MHLLGVMPLFMYDSLSQRLERFVPDKLRLKMAEEVRDASVAIPRAIMLSVLINGSLGFGMLIAVLFCLGDLEAALETPTGYPYMEIFRQGTDSVAGALGMTSIILIIGFSYSFGFVVDLCTVCTIVYVQ